MSFARKRESWWEEKALYSSVFQLLQSQELFLIRSKMRLSYPKTTKLVPSRGFGVQNRKRSCSCISALTPCHKTQLVMCDLDLH